MADEYIEDIVSGTLAIIFGLFMIDLACGAFLGFQPVELLKKLIRKIIGKKED